MFKQKKTPNFYGVLIKQAQTVRDTVNALCTFCESPTQENGDFVKAKEQEMWNNYVNMIKKGGLLKRGTSRKSRRIASRIVNGFT